MFCFPINEIILVVCRTVVEPGMEYWKDLTERTGPRPGGGKPLGELKELKEAFMAGRVFDPIILATMSVAEGEHCIDELVKFGFPEFGREAVITDLKSELPTAIAAAREIGSFNWSTIAGCKEYDAKIGETAVLLDNSIVRETCPTSWKDDPTERARRTWKWWIVRWSTMPAWKKALRLVVLVQPSSAAAERVFTQLKLIVEACGESMLAETVLYRMLRRCNHGIY